MSRILLVIVFIFSIIYKAQAQEKVSGHESPLPSELLPEPVVFENCSGIKIIEWRASKNKKNTEINKKSVYFINIICKTSFANFEPFLKSKGINYSKKDLNIVQNISILPWDPFGEGSWDGETGDGDGDDYRNLQDYTYRFKNRTKFYKNGRITELLGYTDRNHNAVYVMNDVLNKDLKYNPKFAEVFAHELFHAMSNMNGVYDNLGKTTVERQNKDEELAHEFTKFLEI
jgi:hypothetical protein